MNIEYILLKTADHLYMDASGEYSLQDFKSLVKIIRDKCEEKQTFKILLNALGVNGIDIPTLERYLMGVDAAKQLNYKIKLAVVWHINYINYLGETVAINRGGQVGAFGNNVDALKWLLKD